MTKFLIIFLLITAGIVLAANYFLKRINKFFSFFIKPETEKKNQNEKEVIYSKDDIVVLKGEARNKKEN